MNIGPLLRSMMGDSRAGESKSLELKTGQVVRGTILSVAEGGQEAVIQVQGVKLHAALETPMRPGETTLLQVQPESKDGLTVLKPVDSYPAAPLSAASLTKALETLGLENSPANRQIVQFMQSNGIPLTKDNVALILQTSAYKPAEVPLSEWIQTAGIVFGRGLPLTGEVVGGLHQAIFGPPLHTLLSSLEAQVGNLLSQGGDEVLFSGNTAAGQGNAGNPGIAGQSVPAASGLAQAPSPGGIGESVSAGMTASAEITLSSSQAKSLISQASGYLSGGAAEGTARQGDRAGDSLVNKLQALLGELRTVLLEEGMTAGALSRSESGTNEALKGQSSQTANTARGTLRAGEPAAAGQAAAAPAAQGEGPDGPSPGPRPAPAAEPWVGRVLKLLGAEHEQQALRAAAPGAAPAAEAPASGGASPQPAAAGGAGAAAAQPGQAAAAAQAEVRAALNPGLPQSSPESAADSVAARETLKGLLLQVMAADDLPVPLKEAARQLVQQLTGQQLLLNTDRTAPFAQITMFLPFIGPDGTQTASVHIESRRSRKGQLDPANCRLWFDLQMKALGQIMVDVQVTDRKVLLKIYSEQEETGVFLESREDEIGDSLSKAGYRLLSMKLEPLIPDSENSEMDFIPPLTYAPSTYKGVDYRV